jgi:hypothetical protein
MERETKTIKIEDHTFEVKSYATAKETNAIQSAYFKGAKVEVVGQQPKISEFDPSVQYNVQLEMVRQIVVKMDDSAENIVDRCEELPNEVFQELAGEIDQLIAKKKK